jgi:hypothetical protein
MATARHLLSADEAAPFRATVWPAAAGQGATNLIQARALLGDRMVLRERWVAGDTLVTFAGSPSTALPALAAVASTSYPRHQASWTTVPAADALILSVEQEGCDSTCTRTWSVLATPAYLAAGGTLETPDLTAAQGWHGSFAVETGAQTMVSGFAFTAPQGASGYWDPQRVVGDEMMMVGRYEIVTP